MYKKSYQQMSSLADQIISGEYSQKVKAKREERDSLIRKPARMMETPQETQEDLQQQMVEYLAAIRQQNQELMGGSDLAPDTSTRPRLKEDVFTDTKLNADTDFMSEVSRFTEKWGVSETELFRIIKGESGFNPRIQNTNTKATGLFQFIPSTAKRLGVTVDQIKEMSPAQQLQLYDRYLESWDYDGRNSLAIMQAAPAKANASPNEVIYKKGSKAWEQNPGWRAGKNGPITVASITAYYRGQPTKET